MMWLIDELVSARALPHVLTHDQTQRCQEPVLSGSEGGFPIDAASVQQTSGTASRTFPLHYHLLNAPVLSTHSFAHETSVFSWHSLLGRALTSSALRWPSACRLGPLCSQSPPQPGGCQLDAAGVPGRPRPEAGGALLGGPARARGQTPGGLSTPGAGSWDQAGLCKRIFQPI